MSEDRYIGAIEDIVGEAKFVDGARTIFERLASNAPVFCPERRRFLETAATAAAGAWMGMVIPTEANAREHNTPSASESSRTSTAETSVAKPNPNWEAYLLAQDLIFGPPLTKSEVNGRPNDHANHLKVARNRNIFSFGGVDYGVPKPTPVVATHNGYYSAFLDDLGTFSLDVYNANFSQRTILAHFKSYSKNIYTTYDFLKNKCSLITVVGYSGITGSTEHLHLGMTKREGKGEGVNVEWGHWQQPGIDPFTTGIDGGRPIYHDGKTQVLAHITPFKARRLMEELYAALQEKSKDELGLNNEFYNQLRATVETQNFGKLQDFLRQKVLRKHGDTQGRMGYRFLPGSFMYSLAIMSIRKPGQEFLTMAPCISPLVVDKYREANPGIEL